MFLACAASAFPSTSIIRAQMVTKSAETSDPLKFSNVQTMGDEQAKRYIEDGIHDALAAGSGVTDLVTSLLAGGAKCELLRNFRNKYWCTYESAAPGFPGRYVSREWQIVIDYEDSNKVTSVEVTVARTGP
jgi:hypothetical protein